MSIYYVINDRYPLSVGYNSRIKSYYAILLDNKPWMDRMGAEGPEILVWIGTRSDPIRTAERLADILDPWTTLERDTVEALSDIEHGIEYRERPSRRNRQVH